MLFFCYFSCLWPLIILAHFSVCLLLLLLFLESTLVKMYKHWLVAAALGLILLAGFTEAEDDIGPYFYDPYVDGKVVEGVVVNQLTTIVFYGRNFDESIDDAKLIISEGGSCASDLPVESVKGSKLLSSADNTIVSWNITIEEAGGYTVCYFIGKEKLWVEVEERKGQPIPSQPSSEEPQPDCPHLPSGTKLNKYKGIFMKVYLEEVGSLTNLTNQIAGVLCLKPESIKTLRFSTEETLSKWYFHVECDSCDVFERHEYLLATLKKSPRPRYLLSIKGLKDIKTVSDEKDRPMYVYFSFLFLVSGAALFGFGLFTMYKRNEHYQGLDNSFGLPVEDIEDFFPLADQGTMEYDSHSNQQPVNGAIEVED